MNGWDVLYVVLPGLFTIICFIAAVFSWRRRPKQDRVFRVLLLLPLAGLLATFVDGLLLGSDWDQRIRLAKDAVLITLICWTPFAFFIMWLGFATLSRKRRLQVEMRTQSSVSRAHQG
jgi:amino acid transporter